GHFGLLNMLTLEQAVTIQILHQQGKSIKAISRELGVSRNTVRKYLQQNTTPQYQRIQPRISNLDPYKPYLLQPVHAAEPGPLIRDETQPGQQMQVDFTTIRCINTCLKAFVATLGYSRATFVKFYVHERTDAWFDGLETVFQFFAGVPQEILFDHGK